MRKIYSLLIIMLLACLGNVAWAATAKVYVDDHTQMILYINGDNWDNVTYKLVDGEYVDIEFTEGLTWNLDSTHHNIYYRLIVNGIVIAENFSPVFDIGYDFVVNDGDVVEILMKAPSDAEGPAKAKVYVDNTAGVILYINGDNWDNVTGRLVSGEYVEIEFTDGLTWNLDSSNHLTYYMLVINGEIIAQDFTPVYDVGYDFSVSRGDYVEIYTKSPNGNEQVTVTVEGNENGINAIEKITVNDKEVEIVDGKFQAEKGEQIIVYTDNLNYNISSVTLDDKELKYIVATGGYVGTVEGDATLKINAELKQPKNINLYVNDAKTVKIYQSFNSYILGVEFEGIVDGSNIIEVLPITPVLQIKPNEGYTIDSATYTDENGNVRDMEFDSLTEAYYVDVNRENVISVDIVAAVKVVEYITFGVEVANINTLRSYYIRTNYPREFLADSDEPEKLLHDGLNEFEVTTEQAASIRLYLEFKDSPDTYVTIDGKSVSVKVDTDNNVVWCDFSIENGQILTIGKTTAVTDIEDEITHTPTIVTDGRIYNLLGIELKGKELPRGVYIVNGKKVFVK